jgi:hypothetical protein
MIENNTVPQAVQNCHELIAWLIPVLDKMPRNRRFTLGDKIEVGLIELLSTLVEATYRHTGKDKLLQKANTQLTVLRHLWRLAYELKAIAHKQYQYGGQLIVDLGQQIGGWQKFAQANKINHNKNRSKPR